MPFFKHQVILHTDDNLPENYITNTICTFGPSISDANTLSNLVADWYIAMSLLWGTGLQLQGHEIKTYDMADPEPRAPVDYRVFNLTALSGEERLPSEVAICISFQGDMVSGEPQSRRRGRIYFGPCRADYNFNGQPGQAFTTELRGHAADFLASVKALGVGYDWCVWSTVTGGGVPVTNGWVDNAWDTQRRRGQKATVRGLFP